MIDTNKYEGHTEGPWRSYHMDDGGEKWYEIKCTAKPLGFISVHDDNRNHAQHAADAQLTADAPLLLAEVKRLRERLIRAYDWAENAVNGNDSAMMDYTEYVCGGEEE